MSKFILLTLFLSCFVAVEGQYFIRFLNALEGQVVNFTEISSSFAPTANLGFMEISNYTEVPSTSLDVIVNSGSGEVFNTSQSVIIQKYCTVVLINNVQLNQIALIPLEETLGTTSTDSSVKNQCWFRFVDIRSASYMDKISTYPNTNMVTSSTIFAHIGYLQPTPYRVTDATGLTSFYVRDDTTGDSSSFGLSLSSGYSYSAFIYSDSSSTMASMVVADRTIAADTTPVTVPIPSEDFQSSSNYGSKIAMSAFVVVSAVLVSLL